MHTGIALLELFRDLDLQELIVVCHIQIFEVIDHSITVVLFLSKVYGAGRWIMLQIRYTKVLLSRFGFIMMLLFPLIRGTVFVIGSILSDSFRSV